MMFVLLAELLFSLFSLFFFSFFLPDSISIVYNGAWALTFIWQFEASPVTKHKTYKKKSPKKQFWLKKRIIWIMPFFFRGCPPVAGILIGSHMLWRDFFSLVFFKTQKKHYARVPIVWARRAFFPLLWWAFVVFFTIRWLRCFVAFFVAFFVVLFLFYGHKLWKVLSDWEEAVYDGCVWLNGWAAAARWGKFDSYKRHFGTGSNHQFNNFIRTIKQANFIFSCFGHLWTNLQFVCFVCAIISSEFFSCSAKKNIFSLKMKVFVVLSCIVALAVAKPEPQSGYNYNQPQQHAPGIY